jgi:hypothetical protein
MRALLLRVALFLPVLCVCNPLQNSFVERDGHDGEANAGNATGTSSQPTDWDQKASAQDGDDAADTGVSQAENVVKVVQQLHYGSGGAPPSASETAQFLVDVPSGTFSIVHDTPRLLNASLDTNELSCETDGGTVEVPAGATVSIPAHANGDPTHCQLTFATSAAVRRAAKPSRWRTVPPAARLRNRGQGIEGTLAREPVCVNGCWTGHRTALGRCQKASITGPRHASQETRRLSRWPSTPASRESDEAALSRRDGGLAIHMLLDHPFKRCSVGRCDRGPSESPRPRARGPGRFGLARVLPGPCGRSLAKSKGVGGAVSRPRRRRGYRTRIRRSAPCSPYAPAVRPFVGGRIGRLSQLP